MNLGMPEIMIILVIALIVFGPRKLPELGKSLGKAMAQFRRASDDFKRTWEQEVEMEKTKSTPAIASSSYNSEANYYNPPNEDGYSNYSSETNESTTSGESETSSDHSKTTSSDTATVAPATQSAPSQRPERWI